MIPQRRSASVTAVAWRASAGAAARIPVARAANLARALKNWADSGLRVVGLDAGGDTALDDLDGTDPLVVVFGSEGKGLSRLVQETCDEVVHDPDRGSRRVAERLGRRRVCSPKSPVSVEMTALPGRLARLGAVLASVAILAPLPTAAAQAPAFDLQAIAAGAARRPRKSLRAFAKALELSVSTLELDIVITKIASPWFGTTRRSMRKSAPTPGRLSP